MPATELLRFATPDDLAAAAAREWLRLVAPAQPLQTDRPCFRPIDHAAPAQSGAGSSLTERFCVALSGGRIAARLFSAVAQCPEARCLAANPVQFFWTDERCVPPQDQESNFNLARRLLLTPLRIPRGRIHRIRGEAPPELAAAQADADLRRLAPLDRSGLPVLDLVFLGLGEDGHVASLFPGEAEELVGRRTAFRAVTASKPPPRRITLGYSVIAAARNVWVLASGPGKESALRNSLAGTGLTPLARVLRSRSATRIFTDIVPPAVS